MRCPDWFQQLADFRTHQRVGGGHVNHMSHLLALCRIGAHAVVRVHDVLAGRVEELVGVVLTDEFIAGPIARPIVDLVRGLLAAKTDRHEGLPRNQTERNRIGSVFFRTFALP